MLKSCSSAFSAGFAQDCLLVDRYTRAQRDDFDSWKTEGWSADDMLPFLKKVFPFF